MEYALGRMRNVLEMEYGTHGLCQQEFNERNILGEFAAKVCERDQRGSWCRGAIWGSFDEFGIYPSALCSSMKQASR